MKLKQERVIRLDTELAEARTHTDALFALVDRATLYERPIPDRHRLIFYVGHLEAFDWNQLARGVRGEPSFDPTFDQLFEAGIDPPPGQAPQDTARDWPSVDRVLQYNARARSRIDELWDESPADMRQMVIEHRWMHAETICYLLQQLDQSLKKRPAPSRPRLAPAPNHRWIAITAGNTTLGQRADRFGWDNEFPEHDETVPAFEIAKFKVTNGDYLRFVEDGGAPPPFWRRRASDWWLHRMFDEVPLPADAPVYVTHEQATAYASWANAALPTEAEWHRAAYGDTERAYPWGENPPDSSRGNFDFIDWDPVAVTSHPPGDSALGVSQMVGNGWEWTSTPFAGFDGFEPSSYYPGYSANFFDGEHYVIKGGSPVTSRALLRHSFRNWFRADYPYVFSTMRLVRRRA